MNRDPILARAILPPGDGYRVPRAFRVQGGLHYLRGNSAPHFSLTYTAHRQGFPNQCESGGADHAEILRRFPKFTDLAALHLSDIDGVPMHAEANGWYNLAGALPDGFGEEYHRGNANVAMPDGYRLPTADECLQFFADHCRIALAEARAIRQSVMTHAMRPMARGGSGDRAAEGKAKLAEIMATMRPRWKAEADACIAKHGLVVFGDPWPPA